jgi:isopentenyldiphosphate isomerase
METEELAIFTENMERIGTRTRAEVHARGYWHETFQCWFIQEDKGEHFLLFQLRAAQKKDFPNTLDITAAGHLLSHETPRDGLREIREELGLNLSFEDLIANGIIKDQILCGELKDYEFCHSYFYRLTQSLDTFILQEEEVQGIFCIALNDFERLIRQETKIIDACGYLRQTDGTLQLSQKRCKVTDFCPHNALYYLEIIHNAQRILKSDRALR